MRGVRVYLVVLTILVVGGLGATAAINYIVDPYLVYFTPTISGLTEVKTEQHRFLQIGRAHV